MHGAFNVVNSTIEPLARVLDFQANVLGPYTALATGRICLWQS